MRGVLGEPAPSFRLGHRKTSDSNRAVNGAQSRPEHGVITITIMMRKHSYNLPTPATDPITWKFPAPIDEV